VERWIQRQDERRRQKEREAFVRTIEEGQRAMARLLSPPAPYLRPVDRTPAAGFHFPLV
jgi:hypothetical protein